MGARAVRRAARRACRGRSHSPSACNSAVAMSRFATTAASGLLISWPTPAAIMPIDAMRSEISNCSWASRSAVTSRLTLTAPRTAPVVIPQRARADLQPRAIRNARRSACRHRRCPRPRRAARAAAGDRRPADRRRLVGVIEPDARAPIVGGEVGMLQLVQADRGFRGRIPRRRPARLIDDENRILDAGEDGLEQRGVLARFARRRRRCLRRPCVSVNATLTW